MKRQLDSDYKDLVEFINDKKDYLPLQDFLTEFFDDNSQLNDLATDLDRDYYDDDCIMDKFISIVVDIYNDNYELEGPKYAWRFLPINGELNQLFLGKTAIQKQFYLGNFYNTKPDLFTQNEFDQFIKDNDYLNSEMFKREEM